MWVVWVVCCVLCVRCECACVLWFCLSCMCLWPCVACVDTCVQTRLRSPHHPQERGGVAARGGGAQAGGGAAKTDREGGARKETRKWTNTRAQAHTGTHITHTHTTHTLMCITYQFYTTIRCTSHMHTQSNAGHLTYRFCRRNRCVAWRRTRRCARRWYAAHTQTHTHRKLHTVSLSTQKAQTWSDLK